MCLSLHHLLKLSGFIAQSAGYVKNEELTPYTWETAAKALRALAQKIAPITPCHDPLGLQIELQ